MIAHTPGPWVLIKDGSPKLDNQNNIVYGSDGVLIVYGQANDADAQLIAAAPDLLAALQAVLHDCENLDMVESNEPGRDAGPWLMATNAITKATGGAA